MSRDETARVDWAVRVVVPTESHQGERATTVPVVAEASRRSLTGGDGCQLMLIIASLVGAGAVSLFSSYAFGDTFNKHHSLHHSIRQAPFFYGTYAVLIVASCLFVGLGSNALLRTATQYVQVLAGILLPSASLFLVLLCNDTEVLGPWVNGRLLNFFAVLIVAVLIVLSLDLTVSTLFPSINGVTLTEACFAGAAAVAAPTAVAIAWVRRRRNARGDAVDTRAAVAHLDRRTWRMRPVDQLAPPRPTLLRVVSVYSLRAYVIVALVIVGIKAFSPFIG